MTTNGDQSASCAEYQKFIDELKKRSKHYSENRQQNPEERPNETDALDYAAFIDSLFTDYVNGCNNVHEKVLDELEKFEKSVIDKNVLFEDFLANIRKTLDEWRNGKM